MIHLNCNLFRGMRATGRAVIAVTLGFLIAASALGQSSNDSLANWEWRNPLPTGGILWDTVFANDTFLTVGSAGEIFLTPDGLSWTPVISGTEETLNSVAHGNDLYVAVGEEGTILTSSDGRSWTSQTSGTTQRLFGVAYGADRWVVVGLNGVILTSTDGATWQSETSNTTDRLADVLFAGSQFVAAGGTPNDHGSILTSPDGVTWTMQTVSSSQFLTGTGHNGSLYVTIGEAGTILSSPDGVTWTARASQTFEPLQGIIYAGNQFITVGFSGTILTSADGITWVATTGEGILLSVTAGNSRYLTVGFSMVMSSIDGATWTKLSEGATDPLNDMAYSNDVFLVVGDDGTLLRSVSGVIWSEEDSTVDSDLYRAAAGGDSYVATGAGGVIIHSADAETWTTVTSPTLSFIDALIYADGEFMAVDGAGAVITSPDGVTWTALTDGDSQPVNVGFVQTRSLAYGNSSYVAAGASGSMSYSTNKTSWSSVSSGTTRTILDVTYGLAGYVAVGQQGVALRSQNGLSWTVVNTGVLTDLSGVSYGPDGYVASGVGGVIMTSTDGLVWVQRYSRTTNALNASLYGNGLHLVAGRLGTILAAQVDPGKPLVNLSTRGFVNTGDKLMIAGFVLTGGVSPSKTVLIRAAGPALDGLGVTGFLEDPFLELIDDSGTVGTNDNWGDFSDQTALAAATQSVGAFPFPTDSLDAAYLVDLPNGRYTVQVTGVGATTGVSIVEVYDVSQGLDDPRMVNISTRVEVRTGNELAIPGYVIDGDRPKVLLVRAVGPTLGSLINDPNIVLQDPQLTVVDSENNEILVNGDWGDFPEQAALQAATTAVGAFSLNNSSKDAAALVVLDPGLYTIKVVGADGGTGIALVEVYEVQ